MKIFTITISFLFLIQFSYQGSSSTIEYTNECTLTKTTPVNVFYSISNLYSLFQI